MLWSRFSAGVILVVIACCLGGMIVGGTFFFGLRWLLWELNHGWGSDHGYDYAWGLYILAGMITGIVATLWLSWKIGKQDALDFSPPYTGK